MPGKKHNSIHFLSGLVLPIVNQFPTDPSPGQPVIKGNTFFICLELNGKLVWYPANNTTDAKIFTQGLQSKNWSFQHKLGNYVIAVPYDMDGNVLDVKSMQNVIGTNSTFNEITVELYQVANGTLVVYGMVAGTESSEIVTQTTTAGEIEALYLQIEQLIDNEAEAMRAKLLSSGDGQALEYAETNNEVSRYRADSNPQVEDYPFLAAEIGLLGEDLESVVQHIEGTTNIWRSKGSTIKKIRRTAKEQLKSAKNANNVQGMLDSVNIDWSDVYS